jgi:NAD(P)-dependent dehydrogenase (short-subunit alcohol dehydrogenase family)
MDLPDDLAGRVALVTGGSRGIGHAVARALVERGVHVGLVARTAADLAGASSRLVQLEAGRVHAVAAELADPAQASAAAEGIAASLGPIDFLVNCAGAAESAPFARTSLAVLRAMLDANLVTTWNAMQCVVPAMVKRGSGRVVNVASLAGTMGYRYVAAYCAAKHAVVGLTRSVALEVASAGVTVNAVCPGYVQTPMLERSLANIVAATGRTREEALALLGKDNPQRRVFSPEEVAHVVLMLLGREGRGINGQALAICGGQSAG